MSLRTPRPLLLGIALGLAACGAASPADPHDARVIPASPTVSTTESTVAASASSASSSSVTSTRAATSSTTVLPSAAAASPTAAAPRSAPTPPAVAPTATASPAPALGAWSLTVYYTAVESFHTGPPQAVTGCRPGADECSNGTDPLGSYPTDFLDAVRSQGAGRITAGKYAGKYLMWDADSGYAVDTAALDQSDAPLRPFVSAGAGDPGIAAGTAFSVLDCGVPADAGGCARLRAARWVVTSTTRRPTDAHTLELYVGEEDGPGFGTGALIIHSHNARTTLG
ncbi:MAG TPA: hypothetical protein VF112_05495 [Candidatus Dormibacteraeota bacterium]